MMEALLHSPAPAFAIVALLIPIAWATMEWAEPHKGADDEK